PLAVAACPVGAVKPKTKEITTDKGETKTVKTVEINKDRCMFCGNCYTMCPSLPLADTEGDGLVLMVGGKVSNRISAPKFSKCVVAFIPNEPPRWPQLAKTIRTIFDAYANEGPYGAKKYERIGDWAERIGWERFFDVCGLEFTHHLIDDFRDPAYYTWRQTTNFKFTD
ncbi:MAG: 4Fe-4S dicluster domain-containing protein, partial [Desulfohalobiaceae bacterium]